IIISNVSAYSSYSTQATITYFEKGIPQSSTGTISGTPVSSSLYNLPSSFPLFPVNITNTQNVATPSPFQQMINVSASSIVWPFINNNPFGQNIEFIYPNGTVIPSWLESYSSTNAIWWIKIGSIPANSKLTIYMRVVNPSTNLFNNKTTGEAPQLSPTYAEYDNGANIFLNYFPGYSLTGWTTSGTAGVTNRAPSGNPIFGSHAFYANGSVGDYLYTIASSQSNNMIIEYYAYTPLLQDLYFLVNSTGFGQMARDGNGSAYGYKWYGIIHTYSWTNWNGYGVADPSFWSNEWVTIGVLVNNGVAIMYLTPRVVPYGSEIGSNPTNSYNNVTDAGNYLGLVGDDAAGDSVIGNPMTTQYWNGIIIRAYPPNGVMPSVSIG
ncbi:MAG: DUF2341 domain-containing protein, partial [Candidatus Rehaiarchaeum fermentans]|nr:DUF2341 domain-containing protein [Candidatus Rehaiarchaeum fermentans]